MESTIPVEISILHTPDAQFTNPLYASLTPPGLKLHEAIVLPPFHLNTTLGDIKQALHTQYNIPLEILWGFQRGLYNTTSIPDSTTLAELRRHDVGPGYRGLFLVTTAWRVKTIHEEIYSAARRYEHAKAVAGYYLGKWVKRGEAEMREKAEEHEMGRVRQLEEFRGMVSDLVEYSGDGSEDVPELEEAALMGWLEKYRRGKEEKVDRIAAERLAALEASSAAKTLLLQDITDHERKIAEYSDYGCFFAEQNKPLQALDLSYQETKLVLNELWTLLGETGRQPYVSQAVQERRECDALRKITVVSKDDTHGLGRFTFDHPPLDSGGEIIIRPLRNREKRLPETAFTITSGKLLWGHMQTVIAGSRTEGFDGNAEQVPPIVPGGTIRQHVYNYRCAARNGNWMVRKAYSNFNALPQGSKSPDTQFGWIIHHEDVDPLATVERCSRIMPDGGISRGNTHHDKDVLYIGRYDWSWHCGNPTVVREALKEEVGFRIPDREGLNEGELQELEIQAQRWGCYMMLLDAEKYSPGFLASFLRDCPVPGDRTATTDTELTFGMDLQMGEGERFGSFLSMPRTEYEFAWFVFSGEKHDKFKETDELIAIIYDGAYHTFEGNKFAVET